MKVLLTGNVPRGNSATPTSVAAHGIILNILDGVAAVFAAGLDRAKTAGGSANLPNPGVGGDG